MKLSSLLSALLMVASLSVRAESQSAGRVNPIEITKKTTENQIHRIIDPVLDRYCREDCKLLNISVQVDTRFPEHIAPGFDDVDAGNTSLGPSSAKIKLLINDKVGPVSRAKLIELMEQYLENLDFETEIETQLAKFPDPVESATKVIEMREKIAKQFKATLEELFKQFCPKQCLLGDHHLRTETVNTEEAQYGQPGEYVQDGGVSLRIKELSATLLLDDRLSAEAQANILEMARLRTNHFRNVELSAKPIHFPHPVSDAYGEEGAAETDSDGNFLPAGRVRDAKTSLKSDSTESRTASLTQDQKHTQENTSKSSAEDQRQEKFERFERIERVENGDAVQQELRVVKTWGLIFACSILGLLILLAIASLGGMAAFRKSKQEFGVEIKKSLASESSVGSRGIPESAGESMAHLGNENTAVNLLTHRGTGAESEWSTRMQAHQLHDELLRVFAEHPKVAKAVFTRVLTEEGIETTAKYLQVFGETVILEMLRDPSLISDLDKLIDFYAHNPVEISANEKLDLLKRLHNRAVAGKLLVFGNRSSDQFDFIANLDATQVFHLIQSESTTARALVLTQMESQKRTELFEMIDENSRTRLMSELARIDHLPKAYIAQVSDDLRRKLQSQPQLNTEVLPGSDILVDLLEKSKPEHQRNLIRSIGADLGPSSGSTLRVLKKKMISLNTLSFLENHVALDVVLGLPHSELVQFLKVCPGEVRDAILSKSPDDLRADIQEELPQVAAPSREAYERIGQKILNRIKILAHDGSIDLYETNSKMFNQLGIAPNSNPLAEVTPLTPPPLKRSA